MPIYASCVTVEPLQSVTDLFKRLNKQGKILVATSHTYIRTRTRMHTFLHVLNSCTWLIKATITIPIFQNVIFKPKGCEANPFGLKNYV
ncbi:MAG: hypothetical protein RLZZ628_3138 [Bacteroidota bacterium]|jgi:hypothetical protein